MIYDFDLAVFRSERTYRSHTQPLPSEYISVGEEDHSVLFRKFSSTSITFDESNFSGRYAWVDTIEKPQLARLLRQLSDEDLELLTFLVIEGHTQWELAHKWRCSQAAVSKRFLKIKNFLKK